MKDHECPAHSGETGETCPWDARLKREVTARARKNAPHSHIDEERAAEMAQAAVESRANGNEEITELFVRALGKKLGYGHPLSDRTGTVEFTWTPEALAVLEEVPEFCRDLTRWRVEWTAHKLGLGNEITPEIVAKKYQLWGAVSHQIQERERASLPWTEPALRRFEKIPDFVKGQVLQSVEGNAREMGATEVDDGVVDSVIQKWIATGDFHEGRFGFK